MKKLLAITLAVLIMMSAMVGSFTVFAADNALVYSFSGDEKNEPGFAQGTITIKAPDSASAGTFYLYWADGEKALDGYRYICKLTVSANSTASYTMLENTVIPPKATQVIAIKSTSVPTNKSVSNAACKGVIPTSKRLSADSEFFYTFGAISDPQLVTANSSSYDYDEVHLEAAFETLAKRNVDFTVVSGDIVNDQMGAVSYADEYKVYQKILADSSYVNPIYESNGNHDLGTVWESNGAHTGVNYNAPFIMSTGLDSNPDTINAGKPYFEITEPTTGDHFIFMALEGGFYTNEHTQFSTAQLDWLEGLLKKYKNDGKNIFILEHANIHGWGSGDNANSTLYNLELEQSQTNVKRFISLMETYKECVIITGHTHLELSAHYNYSDNNGTSAVMMHNSAIGGVRRLINGSVNRDEVLGLTEGYIVDVYEDCIIFNGTNMYSNEIMPDCSYIIPFDTTENEQQPTQPTTEPTQPTTEEPTQPTTEEPTQPTTDEPTQETTEPTQAPVNYGDVDLDNDITILDANAIQRHLAKLITLSDEQMECALVTGAEQLSILDATYIQRYLAKLITQFPAQRETKEVALTGVDIMKLMTTVKNDLSTYYTYSSFDQYQALKKSYNETLDNGDTSTAAYNKLNSAYEAFHNMLDGIGANPGDTIDVYFTNTANWSTVNAYAWGTSTNHSWPGAAMTQVGTNELNQKVYKITLQTGQHNKIIFNNGSEQTMDLILYNLHNEGFYLTSKDCKGKYVCGTYLYK